MAQVSPARIATGSQAALSRCRSGSPNETLEAPQVMLLPSWSRISSMVRSVTSPAWGSAATVIAIGSMTTSSAGMP